MLFTIFDLAALTVATVILVQRIIFSAKARRVFTADLVYAILWLTQALPLIGQDLFANWNRGYLISTALLIRVEIPACKVAYRLVIFSTMLAFAIFGRSRKRVAEFAAAGRDRANALGHQPRLIPLGIIPALETMCWPVLLFLPLLAVAASPEPQAYTRWAVSEVRGLSPRGMTYYAFVVTPSCLVAVLCYSIILWIQLRKTRKMLTGPFIIGLLFAIVASWIQGKRNVIFYVMLITFFYGFIEGRIKVRHAIIPAILFLVFMSVYLSFGKELSNKSIAGDLFRDYTLRPLVAGAHLTDHEAMGRGDGLVFQTLFFVPRATWPNKPWPTSRYLTKWIIGTRLELDWGFGNGFIEDGLGNFGYVGWIAYTLFVLIACRWLDRLIYKKSTVYLLVWIGVIYASMFAFSVIIVLVVFMFVPLAVLAKSLGNPANWVPVGGGCEEIAADRDFETATPYGRIR